VGALLGRRVGEPVAEMGASGRHANIEVTRAVAILAVFGYHFLGFWRAAGGVARLGVAPHGLERRVLLYGGTWGVSVFVVVSALVLVRSLDQSSGLPAFYRRRLLRIFPLFWWIAVPLMVLAFAAGRMQVDQLWKVPFWLTGTEILWPGRLWPVTAAWWFITLIVQIYLVFPLLVAFARRFGPAPLMGFALVVNLACLTLAQYGDHVFGRGAASFIGLAFVGSRLVEVAAGVSLGLLYWQWSAGRRPSAATVATVAWSTAAAYLALRLFDWEFIAQPWALVFVVLMLPGVVRAACGSRVMAPLLWVGAISYAFYLAHSLTMALLVQFLAARGVSSEPLALAASLVMALAVAAGFHFSYRALVVERRLLGLRPLTGEPR